MQWITEYWYIFLLGLIAVMFIFGNRAKGGHAEDVQSHRGRHANAKKHESGHGCC